MDKQRTTDVAGEAGFSAETKAAIDKMIETMEATEKEVRSKMEVEEKESIPNDRFMAGWAYGIDLGWEHFLPDEWPVEGTNNITCTFEFSGIHVYTGQLYGEKTDVDLTFLTTEIFQNEILPALRVWAQNKVDSEPFGGLYGARFGIGLTLHTKREVREDDPFHMKGTSWEQGSINVIDEKRMEKRKQMAYDFVANEEYKTEDISEIDNSLYFICTCAAEDYFETFGKEKLAVFFDALFEKAKEAKYSSTMGDVMNVFSGVAAKLASTKNGHTPTEDELDLACDLAFSALQNGTDKYEKDHGRDSLEKVAALGHKRANDILKFGTGKIPQDILQYKDKSLICSANDIDKIVDIKIKEESAPTYEAAVRYLIRLLQNGFPGEYAIKCNSKVKNYIPTELKKTKTNRFFANAASYPEVYEALKEYAREAFDEYNYYSDAEEEEAVTCGGYAAMALAFADPEKNFDIGLEFLENSDFEHTLTSRDFAVDFAAVLTGENKVKIEEYDIY